MKHKQKQRLALISGSGCILPWETLATLSIAAGWACCLLQAVQQIALGASHAGSHTCFCTELPSFTLNTDTFTTISKTTVLRMMCNTYLKPKCKTGQGEKAKGKKWCCVTSESSSPGPHTGHATHVPLGWKNSVWSQLGSDFTSTHWTWGNYMFKIIHSGRNI